MKPKGWAIGIALAVLGWCAVIGLIVALAGCSLLGGAPARTEVRPGSVTVKQETVTTPEVVRTVETKQAGETVAVETTRTAPTVSTKTEGVSVGAGAKASGDKLSESMTGSPPALDLPGIGGGTGGGIERTFKGAAIASNPLAWIGGLALVGGVATLMMGMRRLGFGLAGGGLAAIAAAAVPAWAWVILAVAGLGIVGWIVWAEVEGKRTKGVLTKVATAVSRLDEPAADAFKAQAGDIMDAKDKAVVDRIKRDRNL